MKRLLAILAVVFSLVSPAYSDLLFPEQNTPHQQQMLAWYEDLPERSKDVDIPVRERSLAWFRENVGSNTVGVTSSAPYMYIASDYRGDLEVIFKHEYAHHVWFQSLSNGEKVDWYNFWAANIDKMPRWYAKVNSGEGWAECYALAFMDRTPKGYRALDAAIKAKVLSFFEAANQQCGPNCTCPKPCTCGTNCQCNHCPEAK